MTINPTTSWWGRQRTKHKILYAIGAGVLVIILIAAVIGWFMPDRNVSTGNTRPDSSKTQTQGDDKGAEDSKDAEQNVSSGEYTFKRDENGMVIFPETTDPREAAAAAAAVAFNVDFTKVSREEFFEIATDRMTHPSEKYKGPEGEIHTRWGNPVFEEPVRDYADPGEVMFQGSKNCGLAEMTDPPCTWWEYANSVTYKGFVYEGKPAQGTPRIVMSEEELEAWSPGLVKTVADDVDHTPDTPGATLSQWYVLTDVKYGDPVDKDMADVGVERPAQFFIWCDAPDDGGLCAVASSYGQQEFPNIWPDTAE